MKGSGWVVISCSGQVPVPSVAPPVLGPAETQPPLTISAAPEPRRSAPPSAAQRRPPPLQLSLALVKVLLALVLKRGWGR